MLSLESFMDGESALHSAAHGATLASEIVSRQGVTAAFDLYGNIADVIKTRVSKLAHAQDAHEAELGNIDVTTLRGYQTWKGMFKTMSDTGLICVSYQEEFRRKIMNAMLPLIYSEYGEWDMFQNAIRAYHSVPEIKPILAMSCARQMGKSTVVAAILCAMAVNCRGLNILVLSLNKRAALNLKGMWEKCMAQVNTDNRVGHGFIRTMNTEVATTSRSLGSSVDDVCTFKFVPSTASGSRGQQVHFAVVDEAAFVREEIFLALLLPLIAVAGCVCVCISTPPTFDNFFTQLLTKRDSQSGELIADVLRIETICPECRKKRATTCPHVDSFLPPWQSDLSRRRLVSELFGGHNNDRDRETSGIVVMDARTAFEPVWIDALISPRAHYTFGTVKPDAIMIAIDPSGGGASHVGISILGVCLGIQGKPPTIVIIGGASIEAERADGAMQVNAVKAIIKRLRSDTRFSSATLVACVEGNIGYLDTNTIGNAIAQSDPNVIVMSEARPSHSKKGMVSGAYVMLDPVNGKQRYVLLASFFLRSFRIRMLPTLITPDRDGSTRFRDILIHQLRHFMVEVSVPRDGGVHQKIRRTYSGKAGGANDDACMAFLMGLYHISIFYASRSYAAVRNAKPHKLTIPDPQYDDHIAEEASKLLEYETNPGTLAERRIGRGRWDPNAPTARRSPNFEA